MTSYPTASTAAAAPLAGAIAHRRTDPAVARTRGFFALGFLAFTAIEFIVCEISSRPVDLWARSVWMSLYSAGIDAGTWWCCIAMAEAFLARMRSSWRYAIGTLAAGVVAVILHSLTQTWLFEAPYLNAPRDPFVVWWQVGFVGLWRLSLVSIAYSYRMQLLADNAVLERARLERSALARRTAESRLGILQARVDPRLLFDALADVERYCDSDPARADAILDRLVAYLRAALPQAVDRPSTIGTEIELVRAYLSLASERGCHTVALHVKLDDPAMGGIAMAPMLLLPVVQEEIHAAGGRTASVDLHVQRHGACLRIEVCLRGGASAMRDLPGLPPSILTRLSEIYGSTASLQRSANPKGIAR